MAKQLTEEQLKSVTGGEQSEVLSKTLHFVSDNKVTDTQVSAVCIGVSDKNGQTEQK